MGRNPVLKTLHVTALLTAGRMAIHPVDRKNYDTSVEILKDAISQAKMGDREKMEAIKRLG